MKRYALTSFDISKLSKGMTVRTNFQLGEWNNQIRYSHAPSLGGYASMTYQSLGQLQSSPPQAKHITGDVYGISGGGFVLENCQDDLGNTSQGMWTVHNMTSGTWVEIPEEDLRTAKVTIDSVVMPKHKVEQIRSAISQKENHDLIFNQWGFGSVFEKGTAISLLFFGVPGTGKTLMAQAIANELGLKLKIVQTAEIESSEPGQAERNIKAFFQEAEKKKMLLLFDECDSLICDRNEVGMILGAQINALLSGLELFNGVCIFTTNRLGKMDPAFERRVSAKIEFEFPDEKAREMIWKRLIPQKAPINKDVNIKKLAQFPIAGGNIKNVVLNSARHAAYQKMKDINMKCFQTSIEKEIVSLKDFESAFESQPHLPRQVGGDIGKSQSGSLEIEKKAKMVKTPTIKELK